MRIIKFRGVSTESGEWVYGSLICDKGEAFILNGVAESTDEYIAIEDWRPVEIESIGQYIGLEDKTSTEIYEGDIVLVDRQDSPKNINQEVIFDVELAGFCVKRHFKGFDFNEKLPVGYFGRENIEVLGDIYQNPDLLN